MNESMIYLGVVLGIILILLLGNRAAAKQKPTRLLIARGALVEGKRLVNVDGFDGIQYGGMLFSTNMFEYFAKSAHEGEWFIFSKRLDGTVEITRVPAAIDEIKLYEGTGRPGSGAATPRIQESE